MLPRSTLVFQFTKHDITDFFKVKNVTIITISEPKHIQVKSYSLVSYILTAVHEGYNLWYCGTNRALSAKFKI